MSDKEIYQKNPHILQWKETGKKIVKVKGDPPKHPNFIDPELIFDENLTLHRTVCHWGQRKLFLAELDFLLDHSEENNTVIYIGAAPGKHIGFLADLLPDLQFHLYDRMPFSESLKKVENIKIFNTYFTEENVFDYLDNEEETLFLSDIRTADTTNDDRITSELRIADDMKVQADLYEILRPRKALLKFRLPYLHIPNNPVLNGKATFNYLDGEVIIQPFGRRKSTETRLIPTGPGIVKDWDLQKYSDAMHTHNLTTRVSYYEKYPDVSGLDRCYDCSVEKMIWTKYNKIYQTEGTIDKLSSELNENISSGRVFTPLSRPYAFGST